MNISEKYMRCVILLISTMGTFSLSAQTKLYEKAAMRAVTPPGWVSILGSWDAEGRPYIKDMAFMTRSNRRAFSQQFSPNQIQRTLPSGETHDAGVEVVGQSEGTSETWSAHDVLVTPKRNFFTSYKILGPGRKDLPGILEAEGPEAPRLRIWEDGTTLRWDVSVGWQIQVDVTVNEGESWALLGIGKTGQADLTRFKGQDPIVRVQAFRGLRCFVDIFIPGKGILDDPRYYLLPSFFQTTDDNMSAYPSFEFSPGSDPDLPKGYVAKVKVRWDLKKLPFDVTKLFPKKTIQMVFQAEWVNPPAPKDRVPAFRMAKSMLREPSRTKGMMMHRLTEKDGTWKVEDMKVLGPGELPNKPVPEPKITAYERFRKPLDGDMNFSTFWVITSD